MIEDYLRQADSSMIEDYLRQADSSILEDYLRQADSSILEDYLRQADSSILEDYLRQADSSKLEDYLRQADSSTIWRLPPSSGFVNEPVMRLLCGWALRVLFNILVDPFESLFFGAIDLAMFYSISVKLLAITVNEPEAAAPVEKAGDSVRYPA